MERDSSSAAMKAGDDNSRQGKRWQIIFLIGSVVVALGVGTVFRNERREGWEVRLVWPPSTWNFRSARHLFGDTTVVTSHQYGAIMFSKKCCWPQADGVMQEK